MVKKNKELNFPVYKGIKISKEQDEKWSLETPKRIRDLLDGKINLDTNILKKMMPKFIKNEIVVNLSEKEIERVKELYAKL